MPVFLIGTFAALLGIFFATLIWKWHIIKIEKLEPAFGWLAKIVENIRERRVMFCLGL
jgi:hypothetical protein